VTVKGDPITRTPDGNGGEVDTYTKLHATDKVWASVEPASAADVERRSQVQVQGQITHFVTIRYLAGVTVRAIVEFGTRVFHVKGVQNWQERKVFLVLSCEERQ
jgi:head-tail adaptor